MASGTWRTETPDESPGVKSERAVFSKLGSLWGIVAAFRSLYFLPLGLPGESLHKTYIAKCDIHSCCPKPPENFKLCLGEGTPIAHNTLELPTSIRSAEWLDANRIFIGRLGPGNQTLNPASLTNPRAMIPGTWRWTFWTWRPVGGWERGASTGTLSTPFKSCPRGCCSRHQTTSPSPTGNGRSAWWVTFDPYTHNGTCILLPKQEEGQEREEIKGAPGLIPDETKRKAFLHFADARILSMQMGG